MTDSALTITGCDLMVAPAEVRRGMDVVISDGVIQGVHEAGEGSREDGPVLDGTGLLAIPGLVNAHTHSPENCLRGLGEGLALEPWLLRMFGTSGLYTPDDHYAIALAGAVEMLELGVTSVVDHLWMTPPSVEAVDAVMRAYRDVGIRAAVAPLMDDHDYTVDLADSLGVDLGQAALGEHVPLFSADELVAQLRESIERWHDAEDGRLRVLAGPGGVQWASDELLTGLAGVAREHDTGIHIHLLETPLQARICRSRFGTGAVAALDELGILGPDCSLPHSVWASDEDVELIASRGAVSVHNPAANLRLGSGRAPIVDLIAAGATVALGTDGAASSDNQNLWEAIRLASFIHNDAAADRWLTSESTLGMATAGGGAVLGMRESLGTLSEGSAADLTLIDRHGDGLAGAVDTPAGLALSESGRGVRHVIVDGRVVVRDGRCATVDPDAARAHLAEQAATRASMTSEPPAKTLAAIDDMQRLRRYLAEEDPVNEEEI